MTLPALVLLAGGRGGRMGGVDKAALPLGQQTFAGRIARDFAAFPEKLFLGAGRAAAPEGFRALPDVREGIGPIGGLCAALEAMESEAAFAVACDMPFVSPATARLLTQTFDSEAYDVVYASSERGIEPLCAVYSRRCAVLLREMILAGEYAPRKLCQRVRHACVPLADLRQIHNVNTREDYERLMASLAAGENAPR